MSTSNEYNERKLVIVGGVSGCGKTSLVHELRRCRALRYCNVGDIFYTHARRVFGVKRKYDTLTRDWKLLEDYVMSDLNLVLSENTNSDLVLDTHFAMYHPRGYQIVFDPEHLTQLKVNSYSTIFVVEVVSGRSQLLARRRADQKKGTKDRYVPALDVLPEISVELEAKTSEAGFNLYKKVLGRIHPDVRAKQIVNKDKNEALVELARFLRYPI